MSDIVHKLELHRALKDGSPGFHLSDSDLDTIIAALTRIEALEAALREVVNSSTDAVAVAEARAALGPEQDK